MDKTEALLGHFRNMAGWLQIAAHDYESGKAKHYTDAVDDSADIAADLRHKAGNILAVIACYDRLRARDG